MSSHLTLLGLVGIDTLNEYVSSQDKQTGLLGGREFFVDFFNELDTEDVVIQFPPWYSLAGPGKRRILIYSYLPLGLCSRLSLDQPWLMISNPYPSVPSSK